MTMSPRQEQERALAEARAIAEAEDDMTAALPVEAALATLRWQQGRYEEAKASCEGTLAVAREIGDRRGEGIDLNNIGNVYAELGQSARALEYYEQALAIHRELGNRRGEGNTLGNLGIVYADLGQYPQALEFYEQALATRRELGDRWGEGLTLSSIGNVYRNLGQYPQALTSFEQALAIMHNHEFGKRAAVIGEVTSANKGKVRLQTAIGGLRAIEMLAGEQLPRIC